MCVSLAMGMAVLFGLDRRRVRIFVHRPLFSYATSLPITNIPHTNPHTIKISHSKSTRLKTMSREL